ncbi:MAG: hypothetical protein AAF696_07555 [Bacteroidota bacterium]
MKRNISYIILALSCLSIQAQDKKVKQLPGNTLSYDINAAFIPIFLDEFFYFANLHFALPMDASRAHGPCISMWTGATVDQGQGVRYTGLGYKLGPQMQKYIVEFEAGLLLEYFSKSSNYEIRLISGSSVPYFRTHLGFRFRERFAWGAQVNWIPPTKKVRFTNLRSPRIGQGFRAVNRSPNRHFSYTIFVGISVD